ncbi:hypothetical protein O6H91_15G070400 [Diphasiastrum complanatum]|uniref:Uncharacterized protein n=6 Tax=Diphasiastrum complanatum TaxID=34168 RepID=A0ACC2BJE8_DIPCM|nr:hypothetical protein O6H91_Y120100 [Diphasiastrum complanatum]KAJ7299902.1 hypothetical protein O6H91_Y120100 [Diphasiastrum complanatum]KAJ7299903.1 hypothetical protein O6H91_Y120100 [Diphasiastrum complanatum]KAJ7529889.1 hypothetical protein O6H91_15G070400 [Diphasiastrum complanatum]KAJ7529890.1 hypothetical protein O6H91_15G070400 [Diphasiastrum complanatum]
MGIASATNAKHVPGKLRGRQANSKPLASDALPLPVGLTNKIFFVLFFTASYYLLRRWGEKARNSTPLHMLNLGEMLAIVAEIASFIYLIGFFGIDYVQNFINKSSDGPWELDDEHEDFGVIHSQKDIVSPRAQLTGTWLKESSDETIATYVGNGEVPSHSLESELGDCMRAASVRRRAVELTTGRSMEGLPLSGMDYSTVRGQCCEMVVGHVQIPVGVAGPLLLDGSEYTVPMATTEGCLVASTNRGCKAIYQSGGAISILTKDGMTRAPVVRFSTAKRAAELKFHVEDAENFETLAVIFNRTSRFARLQSIDCVLGGRNLHMRFRSTTGDAMGMNMISKGVQNVLEYLQHIYLDMEVVSVSGNLCADKKPTAINWIEGRGKSVVCEAVIKGEVISKVLKTSVSALVELNTVKNLTGSALSGAIGGFNAHAANIVSAIFIATGQDPAQNVESSQCLTLMEAINDGADLHVTVTMPSIEVGTIGGGTQLASQAACLNLLGVKGSHPRSPGANAQTLSRIVAGTVLAGELSLMSALAAGQLVKSHMKYNRSCKDICAKN